MKRLHQWIREWWNHLQIMRNRELWSDLKRPLYPEDFREIKRPDETT